LTNGNKLIVRASLQAVLTAVIGTTDRSEKCKRNLARLECQGIADPFVVIC